MSDHAPQPPPRTAGGTETKYPPDWLTRHRAMLADNAALSDERDRAIERHNVAQETIAVLRDELASAQREAEEARERLAMAVEALTILRDQDESDWIRWGLPTVRSIATPVLAATAASVAQHTAEVERRGAAKELREQAEALLNSADTFDHQTGIAMRGISLRLLARAAELEGA